MKTEINMLNVPYIFFESEVWKFEAICTIFIGKILVGLLVDSLVSLSNDPELCHLDGDIHVKGQSLDVNSQIWL